MMTMGYGLEMKIMIRWLMRKIGPNHPNLMLMEHGIIMVLKQSSEWVCPSMIWKMVYSWVYQEETSHPRAWIMSA